MQNPENQKAIQKALERLKKLSKTEGLTLNQINLLVELYEMGSLPIKSLNWLWQYIALHADGDILKEEKEYLWCLKKMADHIEAMHTGKEVSYENI